MKEVMIKPFTEEYIALYYRWSEKDHVKSVWFLDGYEPVDYIKSKIEGNGYDYPFLIFADEHPIGYIVYSDLQAYRIVHPNPKGPLKDEPKGSVSIDLFIGDEEYLEKGYGTLALKQFSEMLLQKPDINHLIIDPSCDNKRAIRCYEKAGFRFLREEHDGVCLSHIMERKKPDTIRTERLTLRPWTQEDFEPFAALNADPIVREFFPGGILTQQESDEQASWIKENIEKNGWGFWAVSLIGGGSFIGFIGLSHLDSMSAIEIGWRLAHKHWGKGYATEGAKVALRYGFEILNLNEIVSCTAVVNARSRRIMEKLGMLHDPKDDFDLPKVAKDHPLCRHVLYRLTQSEWHSKNHY